MKNKHAQALQKLAHGVPKNFTEEEKEKRRVRMTDARSKRKRRKVEPK